MKTILYIILYVSWTLWLFFAFRIIIKMKVEPRLNSLWAMLFSTLAIFTMFFLLCYDYQSDTFYFTQKYIYPIDQSKSQVIIGNQKGASDLTIENPYADAAHVKLKLNDQWFLVENISDSKNVDINGRYLNKMVVQPGDKIEIQGKDSIEVLGFNHQYPLGRSIKLRITTNRGSFGKIITISTFLNKSVYIRYGPVDKITAGFNTLIIPSRESRAIANLAYESKNSLLGLNIYYFIVFLTISLLSVAIYLYLRNHFNGAVFLLLIGSLPFLSGYISTAKQILIILGFLPLILITQIRRKTKWKMGSVLILISFVIIFFLPRLINMQGDFTIIPAGGQDNFSMRFSNQSNSFFLAEIKRTLSYDREHQIILGYTPYKLKVNKKEIVLSPLNPERIRVADQFSGIISNLNEVIPGKSYIHLKYPHQFEFISPQSITGKDRFTVANQAGNAVVISRTEKEHYTLFSNGLLLLTGAFWLFWFINLFGVTGEKFKIFNLNLVRGSNFFIFNFVYFMLSLGYIMFGSLALYNNYFLKNFEKYRTKGLFWFVLAFFFLLIFSKYNKIWILLFRILKQTKFQIPLAVGLLLMLPGLYSRFFLILAAVYLVFVFFIKLRKDLIYEIQNLYHQPLELRNVNEKVISDLNKNENQRLFFSLGKVLYHQGWNYIIVSDLLLLLSLFFIVLQVFLGGELGVSVAGFFFLPIEIGKILLTIYFADWVSRIDRGMHLGVLWIYGLVLVPFLLLIVFLKDFSPLLVFSFVFLYHIIKIKKSFLFKIILLLIIVSTLTISIASIGEYTFPFKTRPYNLILTLALLLMMGVMLLRIWMGKYARTFKLISKFIFSALLILALFSVLGAVWHSNMSVPRVLGDRIDSWLNPWQDYNLSYQFVNSLWLMKGAGLLGNPTQVMEQAVHVPLIEQDLSFSLYIGVFGLAGIVFIFATLVMLVFLIHRLVTRFRDGPFQWEVYVIEFLTVIFCGQFIFPALYVVGLLPIMSQPLPFLSYSNNMLLLFSLPFSLLIMILINNLERS